MKELNYLVKRAEKADSLCILMHNVDPHHILALDDMIKDLKQRAEAAEAKLAELVPDEKPDWESEDCQDIDYMEPSDVYRMGKDDGWNSCRSAILRNIEGVTVRDWTPPISLEKAKGIISYWSEKGHGASCSGLTECALARKVIKYYEG